MSCAFAICNHDFLATLPVAPSFLATVPLALPAGPAFFFSTGLTVVLLPGAACTRRGVRMPQLCLTASHVQSVQYSEQTCLCIDANVCWVNCGTCMCIMHYTHAQDDNEQCRRSP